MRNSRCIIAFIMSNIDSCWELSPHRLFPDAIVDEFFIEHIKFNAIASTFMSKAIRRAFNVYGIKTIERDLVKEIIESANGNLCWLYYTG